MSVGLLGKLSTAYSVVPSPCGVSVTLALVLTAAGRVVAALKLSRTATVSWNTNRLDEMRPALHFDGPDSDSRLA
jgi:hypothetical protein